jgi:hypothetical protein
MSRRKRSQRFLPYSRPGNPGRIEGSEAEKAIQLQYRSEHFQIPKRFDIGASASCTTDSTILSTTSRYMTILYLSHDGANNKALPDEESAPLDSNQTLTI